MPNVFNVKNLFILTVVVYLILFFLFGLAFFTKSHYSLIILILLNVFTLLFILMLFILSFKNTGAIFEENASLRIIFPLFIFGLLVFSFVMISTFKIYGYGGKLFNRPIRFAGLAMSFSAFMISLSCLTTSLASKEWKRNFFLWSMIFVGLGFYVLLRNYL